MTILVLPASREIVDGHPRPPSVKAGRGRPSSSSRRQGRSWTAILVLPTSREVVASHPRPPDVMALFSRRHGRSSSFSKHHSILVIRASRPRPPGVTAGPVVHPCHPGLAASSTTLFSWRHRSKIYIRDGGCSGWPWFAICFVCFNLTILFCVTFIFHDSNLIRFHRFIVAPLNPPRC